MWTDPEEARSDFILAAAVAIFGPLVVSILRTVFRPLFAGALGALLSLALLFVYTGLVPLLLARYRREGTTAFGLDTGRPGLGPGVLVALPIVAITVGLELALTGSPVDAVLGTLADAATGPVTALLAVLQVAVVSVGLVLLYTFLTTKARVGFARNEARQLELLRTFGMGAAAAALIIGVLLLVQGGNLVRSAVDALTLGAVVLIADRFVDPAARTTRATVLAPAIVALILKVELFTGNLLLSLREALLGAGLVVAVAVLVETRRYAWAALPVLVASVVWPSPLIPV